LKCISATLFLAFLCSCSTTKVHLYKRYLSDDDVLLITQKLETLGYDVEDNTLDFPTEIQHPTVIYSPLIQDEASLTNLVSATSELGWPDIDVQLLFKGNHWYSKNSVGLFLMSKGVERSNRVGIQDLANQYTSDKCELSAKLKLNPDNTYQISYKNEPNTKSQHKTGHWALTGYPYIQLISSNNKWNFYFEIHESHLTDIIGKVDLLELKPLSSHHIFPNCSFVYGVRT
jgi:hypothetical protein